MRGFESLFQFLVPLAFLAIWALTSLFNRDAQPLPPRTVRPPLPPPPAPQPGSNAGGTRAPFAVSTPQIAPPAARPAPTARAWADLKAPASASPAPKASRRAGELDSDEDMLWLTSRTASTPAAARPQTQSASKKPTRIAPKSRPAQAPSKSGRAKSKLLTGTDGASMTESMAKSYDATPLKAPSTPLQSVSEGSVTAVRSGVVGLTDAAATRLPDLRGMRGSPGLLRDAFVLSIVFGPPAALHRRRP